MFDAIYQVNLHETQCKVSDQEALCEAIGTALEMGGARTGRDLVRALQVKESGRLGGGIAVVRYRDHMLIMLSVVFVG